jgi:two-component system LytT family response regulator
MKTVLIDDERLARDELRRLLQAHPEVEVAGEAANVTEALRLLPVLRPDLIFLDIEMPGRTGFDLLEALPAPHPEIIFVTAYDAFALRAFEVNALDYLLKPVVPARLAKTLAQVRRRRAEASDYAPAPASLSASPPAPAATGEAAALTDLGADSDEARRVSDGRAEPRFREDDQVFLREGERCYFVPVREILLLEAEGNHTRVWFRGEKPLLSRALATLEARLPESLFIRANRAQVVNRAEIERMEPWFSGGLKAYLRGGLQVEFSRRQAQVFRERAGL